MKRRKQKEKTKEKQIKARKTGRYKEIKTE